MKIKVCGLKDLGNIKDVLSLSPDYVGFICYDLSPRFISGLSAGDVANLPGTVAKTGVFVNEEFDFGRLNAYANTVDYFLFDTKTPKHGGSGKAFNWDILEKYNLNVPFFLSGGLSLDNLDEVEKIKHPAFYGVDLNSRFETGPGIKDIKLLQKAFDLLRQSLHNEIRS